MNQNQIDNLCSPNLFQLDENLQSMNQYIDKKVDQSDGAVIAI